MPDDEKNKEIIMDDQQRLELIASDVRNHLRENSAGETLRNVILAMFDTSYAEWLGGGTVFPQCKYESEANGL